MTPEHVTERLAELREAGAELRRRPARETLAALARVFELWRDPRSTWRQRLEAELPGVTGFSPENVREGLARGLAPFSADALLALVNDELGGIERLDAASGRLVAGFDATAVVLAGSIPQPSLLSLLLPLVLRSPVLAKPASRDPLTPGLVAASIAAVDPELGRCIAIAPFGSHDEACLAALLEAPCVAATGSDASIAALAARVLPPRRFIPSGHRLSIAVLGPGALAGAALEAAAEGIALDVALWDQLGCLSPLAVYAVGGSDTAADRLAERLAEALAPSRAPARRAASPIRRAAQRFAYECDSAELRAAAGGRVRLLGGTAQRFAVVREADAALRPAPLHRFVRVHPVADVPALARRAAAARAAAGRRCVRRLRRATPTASRAASRSSAPRACAAPGSSRRRRSPGLTTTVPCCCPSRASRIARARRRRSSIGCDRRSRRSRARQGRSRKPLKSLMFFSTPGAIPDTGPNGSPFTGPNWSDIFGTQFSGEGPQRDPPLPPLRLRHRADGVSRRAAGGIPAQRARHRARHAAAAAGREQDPEGARARGLAALAARTARRLRAGASARADLGGGDDHARSKARSDSRSARCTRGVCVQESRCHVRKPWQQINHIVRSALAGVTLAQLAAPGGR